MSAWQQHVKRYRQLHPNVSLKDALQGASKSYKKQSGQGVIPIVLSKVPAPRQGAPPSVRKFLEANKDAKIVSLQICRVPIVSVIQKVINVLRKLTFQQQNAEYDKLFHLYAMVKLSNGVNFRMERNHVFQISSYSPTSGGECMAAANPSKTLGELMNYAVNHNGKENFFIYDAIENNCQHCMISILKAGGVLTPTLQAFVKQNVKSILPSFFSRWARKITDKAAGADRALHGNGKRKP